MEVIYPILTRKETGGGWIVETDYGPKQGASRAAVQIPPPDPEEAKLTRSRLDAVLARFSLRLADGKDAEA
jgi:hypothetical protein